MTITLPRVGDRRQPVYREIADSIARELQAGRLKPGQRLPTQRELADRLGVTLTTVTRAYAEAERRGLVRGEVGRGTYARSRELELRQEEGPINLGTNALMPLPWADVLADELAAAIPRSASTALLAYQPQAGLLRHRAAGVAWLARTGVEASPDRIVLTAGGQHGLMTALQTLLKPGDEILAEEFTYPGMLEAAARFGLRVRPVSIDPHGLRPDALQAACKTGGAKVLYVQPTIQNPTTSVMPKGRRQEVAAIVRAHGLTVIEDDVYGYLVPGMTPLTQMLPPSQGVYLTSLSKSIAPGIRIGYLHVPRERLEQFATTVHWSVINAPPVMAEYASRLITEGTADRIVEWKRVESAARQQVAARILGGFRLETQPTSPHVWLHPSEGWTAERFVSAARSRGVLVNSAHVFSADPQMPATAVRVCLGTPPSREVLEQALNLLATIPDSVSQSAGVVV